MRVRTGPPLIDHDLPAWPAAPEPDGPIGMERWKAHFIFLLFPVSWFLGIPWLVWPVVSAVLLMSLLARGNVKLPPGSALWLWFLLCMVFSGIYLDSANRFVAYLYRGGQYLSATVLLLYVFNQPRERLSSDSIRNALTVLWGAVVFGGLLGIVAPNVEFQSVAARFLPNSMLNVQFIHDMAFPRLSEVQTILGYPVPRPAAPFTYTNAWASNLALLTPAAIATFVAVRRPRVRIAIASLLALSLIPLVYSLSRGAWISLGIALFYVGIVLSLRRGTGAALKFVVASFVLTVLIMFSPLQGLVVDRIHHPHSDKGRESLDREAIHRVKSSLLLGFGAPLPPKSGSNLPSVGTHGQVWLVLFSHGVLGLAFFLGWCVFAFWSTRRGSSGGLPWQHVVLLVALIQMPFYELLPMQWHVVMVVAALAWRERLADAAVL